MRSRSVSDPATVPAAELPKPVGSGLDAEAYVACALRVERMALDLAQGNTNDDAAVAALIEAAGGEVRVMRRAHRHCEFALSEQWPAGRTLICAFDYLSAGRRELEKGMSQAPEVELRPILVAASDMPVSAAVIYDLVDEASMESFPASDAPSFWGR